MTSPEEKTDPQPTVANLPLWKSFCVGLFGSAFFGGVLAWVLNFTRGAAALDLSEHTTEIVGWAIFVPFYLFVMVSLWKCAYNTDRPILGHVARAYAVLTSLLFIAILITTISE